VSCVVARRGTTVLFVTMAYSRIDGTQKCTPPTAALG